MPDQASVSTEKLEEPTLPLRISGINDAAKGIRSFELMHPDGADLPPFSAGAHIQLRVPCGLWRKYSLCNDPSERHRYVITVKRAQDGKGGSISLTDDTHEGDTLPTAYPVNTFELVDTAAEYLFIAGGIGITPIMSMIRSFGELPPALWKLYYLTRSPEETAFLEELTAPQLRSHVQIHHDNSDVSQALDLWPILERPTRAHIYCCGPRSLLDSVRDMTGHWPPSNVHFESFLEGGGVHVEDRPFGVRLAKSGKVFQIPVGKTILEVLREAGLDLVSSCESGTCGTCRTRLVSGDADHRDLVLMPEEMESQIMICVSRANSDELVLDL